MNKELEFVEGLELTSFFTDEEYKEFLEGWEEVRKELDKLKEIRLAPW